MDPGPNAYRSPNFFSSLARLLCSELSEHFAAKMLMRIPFWNSNKGEPKCSIRVAPGAVSFPGWAEGIAIMGIIAMVGAIARSRWRGPKSAPIARNSKSCVLQKLNIFV